MTREGDETFIRITNKDIYKKLEALHTSMDSVLLQQKETNGKVKWHTRAIYGIGGICLSGLTFVVGWILTLHT